MEYYSAEYYSVEYSVEYSAEYAVELQRKSLASEEQTGPT